MKLILLPGMDGTGNLFKPLLEELDKSIDVTVIVYPQDIEQSYENLTEWVYSQLPVDEDFVLLGESFSGNIAFNIAAKKMPKLKGVIFVAAFLENPKASISWLEPILPLKLLLKLKLPDFLVRKYLLGANAEASLISAFWQSVRAVKPSVLQERLRSIVTLHRSDKRLVLPCSYIGGISDYLVPNKCYSAYKVRCSNLTKHLLAGPHFLLQAEPKICARIIENEIKLYSIFN